MRTPIRLAKLLVLAIMACVGCSAANVPVNRTLLPASRPYTYSDADWAQVLRDYVKNGLVDYDSLYRNREPLDRYYALLSVTGPTSTPDQFPTWQDCTAYWVNAYNALVLEAVVQQCSSLDPDGSRGRCLVTTMYDLSLPQLHFEYKFRVDNSDRTLAQVEEEILQQSRGDVRALLATSRAALGTPPLSSEPIRPSTLEVQLARAAEQALDSPSILRVDHTTKTILVWQLIFRRQSDFVTYLRTRRRGLATHPANVLLELASEQKKRALRNAVGYTIKEIPFDRNLNRWSPAPQPSLVP